MKLRTAASYGSMKMSIQSLLFSLERVRKIPEGVTIFLFNDCQKLCHLSLHSCERDVVEDYLVIGPVNLVMSSHISQDIVQIIIAANFVRNNKKEVIKAFSVRDFKVLFDNPVRFGSERIFLLKELLAILERGVYWHCCLALLARRGS